jgi:hypothetical protein
VLLVQTPMVPVGPAVQSAAEQHAAFGTHTFVPGQFL